MTRKPPKPPKPLKLKDKIAMLQELWARYEEAKATEAKYAAAANSVRDELHQALIQRRVEWLAEKGIKIGSTCVLVLRDDGASGPLELGPFIVSRVKMIATTPRESAWPEFVEIDAKGRPTERVSPVHLEFGDEIKAIN